VAHPPGRVTPGSALLDRTPGGCADDDDVSAFHLRLRGRRSRAWPAGFGV